MVFFFGAHMAFFYLFWILHITYIQNGQTRCSMLILTCTHFIWSKWQSIGTVDVRYNAIRRRIKSYIIFKRRKTKKWPPVRRHQMQEINSLNAAFICCDSLMLLLLPLSFFSSKFASWKYQILWNIDGVHCTLYTTIGRFQYFLIRLSNFEQGFYVICWKLCISMLNIMVFKGVHKSSLSVHYYANFL